MLVAVLNPGGGIRIKDMNKPSPSSGEVLLRVRVCGVCSSDMGVYKTGLKENTILGHEVVGTVEALGAGTEGVEIGQRVTGCIMHGFAEYTLAKAEHLIPISECLTDQEGIVEPFSCMLSGIRRAKCSGAESALIVGAGFMGLSLISLLKDAGVDCVVVSDISPAALQRAREFGADEAYLPENLSQAFTYVFETAGSQGGLSLAGEWTARYGTLTIVGYHPCKRDIDMNVWAGRALTVINAFEYDRTTQLLNMKHSLKLVEQSVLPLKRLFTNSFSLSKVDQAFQTHLNRPEGFIKAYIRIADAINEVGGN